MPRVLLVHWNRVEADERARVLRDAGLEVDCFCDPRDGASLRLLFKNPPQAAVIDLSRIPSHGQAVGLSLRERKATRLVPLVFVEGAPEKTSKVRSLLPDAAFVTWESAAKTVLNSLSQAPGKPVVPGTFAGYSGTPLSRKLRIRENSSVVLFHAPEGFEAKLDPLPEGARVGRYGRGAGEADVVLAFLESRAALARALPKLAQEMRAGRTLWLIWPKKTSALAGDLGEPMVREMGLATGLVDYKVCAVDETWSGLAFAVRRSGKANAK